MEKLEAFGQLLLTMFGQISITSVNLTLLIVAATLGFLASLVEESLEQDGGYSLSHLLTFAALSVVLLGIQLCNAWLVVTPIISVPPLLLVAVIGVVSMVVGIMCTRLLSFLMMLFFAIFYRAYIGRIHRVALALLSFSHTQAPSHHR